MMSKTALIDLTGRQFGRLTVLGRSKKRDKHGFQKWWDCRCQCGTEKPICGESLRSGNTKSCGCLRREKTQKKNHGWRGARSPSWKGGVCESNSTHHRWKAYRLSPKRHKAILVKQGGHCALCPATRGSDGHKCLDVDEDPRCPCHNRLTKTGKKHRGCCGKCVRALLCHPCNIRVKNYDEVLVDNCRITPQPGRPGSRGRLVLAYIAKHRCKCPLCYIA